MEGKHGTTMRRLVWCTLLFSILQPVLSFSYGWSSSSRGGNGSYGDVSRALQVEPAKAQEMYKLQYLDREGG